MAVCATFCTSSFACIVSCWTFSGTRAATCRWKMAGTLAIAVLVAFETDAGTSCVADAGSATLTLLTMLGASATVSRRVRAAGLKPGSCDIGIRDPLDVDWRELPLEEGAPPLGDWVEGAGSPRLCAMLYERSSCFRHSPETVSQLLPFKSMKISLRRCSSSATSLRSSRYAKWRMCGSALWRPSMSVRCGSDEYELTATCCEK